MKIIPMNDPRPGQAVICIECSKPIYADRETILADLDGIPYKAYYHQACLPAEPLQWRYLEERGGYFFWKYEDEKGTVYNCTQEPKPPTNEAGYYSFGYLLSVKGLLKGVTADSILKDWSKS